MLNDLIFKVSNAQQWGADHFPLCQNETENVYTFFKKNLRNRDNCGMNYFYFSVTKIKRYICKQKETLLML
jgi:L-rhamnose isomerase